jgi:hypothetical protein
MPVSLRVRRLIAGRTHDGVNAGGKRRWGTTCATGNSRTFMLAWVADTAGLDIRYRLLAPR